MRDNRRKSATVRLFQFVLMAMALLGMGLAQADDTGADEPPIPQAMLEAARARYQQDKSNLGNTRYIALVNYRQPSWERRFYLIEPDSGRLVSSYVVAHGRGSDPDHDGYADRFSDDEGSHMSSLGFFRTGETYMSRSDGHGLSMRLTGLSESNSKAYERDIVIHGNWYMEPSVLAKQSKAGRSYGCFVFSAKDRDAVVEKLKGGALLYAAY
jgi:hypothetical protein